MPTDRIDGRGTGPKLSDVAGLAGVSVATVSKVINGRRDVATGTRDRVNRALKTSGYVQRQPGRHRLVGTIDLVIDGLDSFWAMDVVFGAEEAAARLGCLLTVTSTRHGEVAPQDWMDRVTSRPTDGVIIALSRTDDGSADFAARVGAPVVLLDPIGHAGDHLPTVGANNWQGAVKATEHLLDLGHRRIGMITGPLDFNCSLERRDGFHAAMVRRDLRVDPDLVVSGDFFTTGGRLAAARLLDHPHPPTAIVSSSDLQAAGLYQEAQRRGLRIPDDVSAVGFDDIPLAELLGPPLTTVRQPIAEMARTAVRFVDALSTGSMSVASAQVQLQTTLVVRQSTAAPAQA